MLGMKKPNTAAQKAERAAEPKSVAAFIWDWTKTIGLALLLALLIRSTAVEAYIIPSGSMLKTLQLGDSLFVNKMAYQIKAPFTDWVLMKTGDIQRGDIVVFDPPFESPEPYIKRVIGIPGDTVAIVDKQLVVNGQAVKEGYIQHTDPRMLPAGQKRDHMAPVKVPAGKLFMMGDNRDESADSRFWGLADISAVRGKAILIYWSFDWERMRPRWSRLCQLP